MLRTKTSEQFNVVVLLSILYVSITSLNAHADEWKSCDVYNSVASEREAAIAFGKVKTKISFLRKQDYASVTIFLDGQTFGSAELIPTGRRLYGDGKPYLGYADKTNTLIVQAFENSDNIIVTSRGDVDFTMFARCK